MTGGDGEDGGGHSEDLPGKEATQTSGGEGGSTGEGGKKYKGGDGPGAGGGGGLYGGGGTARYGHAGGGSGFVCRVCEQVSNGITVKGCGEKSCPYYNSRSEDRPADFTGMGGLYSKGLEGSRGGSGAIVITIV